jgi:hypothetical protein
MKELENDEDSQSCQSGHRHTLGPVELRLAAEQK